MNVDALALLVCLDRQQEEALYLLECASPFLLIRGAKNATLQFVDEREIGLLEEVGDGVVDAGVDVGACVNGL